MYCEKCGTMLELSDEFCGCCGTNLKKQKDDYLKIIVMQLQKGENRFFDDFYHMTQKYVRYVAVQVCGNDKERIEDVVQEVYVTIFKKIHTLQEPAAAWGWMKMITRNTALNIIEKESRYKLLNEEEEYILDNVEESNVLYLPEDLVSRKETSKLLTQMIGELPVLQKMIFLEYYYNDKKIAEISRDYEISEGTIKSYLSRGRKILASKVTAYQQKTGVRLCSVSAAPIFLLFFKEGIQKTAVTAQIPSAVTKAIGTAGISKTVAAGAKAAGNAANHTSKSAVKTFVTNAAAKRAVAGIAAVTVAGTGAVQYAKNHTSDKRMITALVEEFEDACQDLDDLEAKKCLSNDSQNALKYIDLMKEYANTWDGVRSISEKKQFDLQVKDVQVFEEEARAFCVYISEEGDGKKKIEEGYLGFVYENDSWKIDLCRSTKKMFQSGEQTKNVRFPELIKNEMAYNDELEIEKK